MNIINKLRKLLALVVKKNRLNKAREVYSKTNVSDDLSKTVLSDGANLTLNTKSLEQAEKIKTDVLTIVEQSQCDADKLLGYIKASNTKIYTIMNAAKLLKNIGEEEGFIPEKKGFEALYLSFITMSGIKFETPDVFVFSKINPEKYLVLYNFYKWYSKKSGLAGFDQNSQTLFKKYYKNTSKLDASGLNLEQIVKLQEAISRDTEAIDFTLKYEKEHEVSKKVSDKISNDGGASV